MSSKLGTNVTVAFGFSPAGISSLKSTTPFPSSQSLIFTE
ncbi:hypothetical protein Javan88_0006 [Streptococcus phage Javan88]|nr:hypothetical protein Javan88_0006 [Streptococcus phage Javan88]